MAFLDLLGPITKIIDKVIPDQGQREKAKLDLLAMQQAGELKELELSMSAIVAEAQSADKWTSRALPMFLYVMYALFLWAIPFSLLYMAFPERSDMAVQGFQKWLAALPEELYWLFGTGYLGYSGVRTTDKFIKAKNGGKP